MKCCSVEQLEILWATTRSVLFQTIFHKAVGTGQSSTCPQRSNSRSSTFPASYSSCATYANIICSYALCLASCCGTRRPSSMAWWPVFTAKNLSAIPNIYASGTFKNCSRKTKNQPIWQKSQRLHQQIRAATKRPLQKRSSTSASSRHTTWKKMKRYWIYSLATVSPYSLRSCPSLKVSTSSMNNIALEVTYKRRSLKYLFNFWRLALQDSLIHVHSCFIVIHTMLILQVHSCK